jgi:hypothetical protein
MWRACNRSVRRLLQRSPDGPQIGSIITAFPEASLRSRTVGLPESGSDLGWPLGRLPEFGGSQRYPTKVPHRCLDPAPPCSPFKTVENSTSTLGSLTPAGNNPRTPRKRAASGTWVPKERHCRASLFREENCTSNLSSRRARNCATSIQPRFVYLDHHVQNHPPKTSLQTHTILEDACPCEGADRVLHFGAVRERRPAVAQAREPRWNAPTRGTPASSCSSRGGIVPSHPSQSDRPRLVRCSLLGNLLRVPCSGCLPCAPVRPSGGNRKPDKEH